MEMSKRQAKSLYVLVKLDTYNSVHKLLEHKQYNVLSVLRKLDFLNIIYYSVVKCGITSMCATFIYA